MNHQTKILVIHMKELMIGLIIAVVLVILTIFAICCFGGKSESKDHASHTTNSGFDNTKATSSTAPNSNATSNTYHPGIYTSSISVAGTPVEIQVTVDEDNINAIELKNLTDSVTTMYPMMQTSFDELVTQVIKNGSTANISYDATNKYTAAVLLEGIQAALDKCQVN